MTIPQAHFQLEVLMTSPKRFEWVKMNIDTGAAVNTFPLNFGPDGARNGRFYRTASGVSVFLTVDQGYDENGLCRSLFNGGFVIPNAQQNWQ